MQFWEQGSNSTQASFSVNDYALTRIQPDERLDAAGLLSAFDLNHNLNYAIPTKVYRCNRPAIDIRIG